MNKKCFFRRIIYRKKRFFCAFALSGFSCYTFMCIISIMTSERKMTHDGNLEHQRPSGLYLEDLINRTNDSYREKKLALIQKIPTPSRRSRLISPAGTSLWLILTRRVPWTISERFRGFPYALMPRNAVHLLFLCRTSMLTRSVLWRSLRLRVGLPLLFCTIRGWMRYIMCLSVP